MREEPSDSPGKEPVRSADSLAVERTLMANERTGLAYLRTALGMVLGGLAMFRFFERQRHDFYEVTGILAIAGGVFLAAIGIRNFRDNARKYTCLSEQGRR